MVHIIKRLRSENQSSEQIDQMLGMSASERSRLEASEDYFLGIMAGRDSAMEA